MRSQRIALASAVQHIVRDHRMDGVVLWAGEAAQKLQSEYPKSGIAPQRIADMLTLEAIRAGVPMQLPCRSELYVASRKRAIGNNWTGRNTDITRRTR